MTDAKRVRLGVRQGYTQRNCQECDTPFQPSRRDQLFCSPKCRFDDKNRAFMRGVEAYRAMYHLVTVKGARERGLALNELSQLARRWRDEDRSAGKPPPPLPNYIRDERHKVAVRARCEAMGVASPY